MTNASVLKSVVFAVFLLSMSSCQKEANNVNSNANKNDDHVFKSQEMALKKAKQLQNTLTEKIEKDAKRLQQATQ